MLPAVLSAVLSMLLEEDPDPQSYDEGYDDGYDEAYTEGYEEGYEEAAAASQSMGPVVHAEELSKLAAKSLADKKAEVIHAVPAAPAAAAVV